MKELKVFKDNNIVEVSNDTHIRTASKDLSTLPDLGTAYDYIQYSDSVWYESYYVKENSIYEFTDAQKAKLLDYVTNWKQPLEEMRKSKIFEINEACQATITGGFKSSALGSEHFYKSTLEEQSTLNSAINLGVTNDFKAQVVNADGTLGERKRYSHTIDQFKQVLADGAIHIGTVIAKKDALEAQANTNIYTDATNTEIDVEATKAAIEEITW